MAHFEVYTSEYLGDGYWADYPPLAFRLEERNDMVLFCTKVRGDVNNKIRRACVVMDDGNRITLNPSDYDTVTHHNIGG